MIYTPQNLAQIKAFLSEGIIEARESNEYCSGAKVGLTKGMGNDRRKGQLKDLQSGTEKILKALWLSRGRDINKIKDGKLIERTLSLGDFIQEIRSSDPDITFEESKVLEEINNSNEIKHGIDYKTDEIQGVRTLLDKLVNISSKNLLKP